MVGWSCNGRLLRKVVWMTAQPSQWTSAHTYYTIQAVPREYSGFRVAAKERAMGRIPAVVLTPGGGEGPASRKQLLTTSEKQIHSLLKRVPFFCSTTFVLQVRAGSGSSVVIQSGTVLPIKVHKNVETGEILNLVLAWAEQGSELKIDVPIVFQGEDKCPGLQKGGYLHKIRSSLKYLCPCEHIPPKIEVDLTNLDIGDKVFMRDVEVHSSLKLLSKNDSIPICMIKATKPEKSEPPVELTVSKTSEATEA